MSDIQSEDIYFLSPLNLALKWTQLVFLRYLRNQSVFLIRINTSLHLKVTKPWEARDAMSFWNPQQKGTERERESERAIYPVSPEHKTWPR